MTLNERNTAKIAVLLQTAATYILTDNNACGAYLFDKLTKQEQSTLVDALCMTSFLLRKAKGGKTK